MLDWVFGGATPTRPSQRAVALCVGVPSSVSASELAVAGYSRQVASFSAAQSPAGSAVNSAFAVASFGPVLAQCTITGFAIFDTTASGAGNMLFGGTLSAITLLSGGTAGSVIIAAGS